MREINKKELLKPTLPKSCIKTENFVVYDTDTFLIIETQPTEDKAKNAVEILNNHYTKITEKPGIYRYAFLPEV